jgi:hypothetical protein
MPLCGQKQKAPKSARVSVCDPDGREYREKIKFSRLAPVSFIDGPLVPNAPVRSACGGCGCGAGALAGGVGLAAAPVQLGLPQAFGAGGFACGNGYVARSGVAGVPAIAGAACAQAPTGAWGVPMVTQQHGPAFVQPALVGTPVAPCGGAFLASTNGVFPGNAGLARPF